MKFLLMGDRHQSPNAPLSRIDDFENTCRNKDLEILQIARDYKVDAILEAGDFFEEGRSRLPIEFVQQIINRWFGKVSVSDIVSNRANMNDSEFLDYISSLSPIRMIGVAGNHELQGGAPESIGNTTLGLMKSLGYIDLPTKDNPIIMQDSSTGKTIAITATSYHPLMDTAEYLNDYIIDKKLGDYHIHIVHGMLTDRSFGPERTQTLVDQILNTKADVTLCGHIHTGFKTICHDGKYFVNPGSVLRLSAAKQEMERTVKVTILEITDKIKLTDIPLKSALPGNMVLTRNRIIAQKNKKSISEFYDDKIASYKVEKSRNINDVFEDVLKKEGIPEDLRVSYQNRINSKKAAIQSGIPEQKDNWIKTIEMVNFQSHKYQRINLDKHMNVFIGESDNGKSAILRALYWVYTGKPSGASFVRYGESECSVTLILANGIKIQHKVVLRPSDPTKVYKNIYSITYADGTEESGNTRLLSKVQEVLGYQPFIVDETQSVDINFMRQGEGWFLISDDISSPQRAKTIGAIMNTGCVDACMKDCEKKVSGLERQITSARKDIKVLDEEIAAYSNLEDEKKNIDNIDRLLSEATLIKEKIERIERIKMGIIDSKSKIMSLENIISELSKYDYDRDISDAKNKLKNILAILATKKSLDENCQSLKIVETIINMLSENDKFSEEIISARKDIDKILQIIKLSSEIKNLKLSVKSCDNIIEETSEIDSISELLSRCSELSDKISRISEAKDTIRQRNIYVRNTMIIISACSKCETILGLIDESSKICSRISNIQELKKSMELSMLNSEKIDSDIFTIESRLKQIEKQREDILSRMDICPICGQTVNNGGICNEHDI